jgi:toxin ParE1/3/4
VKQARFVADARIEFLAEVVYYTEIERGLGLRFASAVEEAAARAVTFPRSGSPSRAKTRKIIVRGFPYSVVYRVEEGEIVIYALAHHSRRPHYWQSRTRSK